VPKILTLLIMLGTGWSI